MCKIKDSVILTVFGILSTLEINFRKEV